MRYAVDFVQYEWRGHADADAAKRAVADLQQHRRECENRFVELVNWIFHCPSHLTSTVGLIVATCILDQASSAFRAVVHMARREIYC